jgi:hypothetical protein
MGMLIFSNTKTTDSMNINWKNVEGRDQRHSSGKDMND